MSSVAPKRFALLVGVDLYSNDGSRKHEDGNPVSLNNLNGCVKDVQAIRDFLYKELQLNEPSVLISSNDPATPAEPPDRWPTFANIKREFDAVYDEAKAGDLFYFHFSGHGTELSPIQGSPNGSAREPSLLTTDFCCGEPAVRGWQLNQWLKRLSDKNVHVVVTLDSCHSGGAWRDGHIRTPIGWTTVLNLPADNEAAEGAKARPVLRDGELQKCWSINPDRLTVMTACESHERASDRTVDHQAGGAFTHALLGYLKQKPVLASSRTYRVIRDHVANEVSGQNPRVFGRDRLLFLGTEEPFSSTPLVGRIEKEMVHLPIGRIHGVQQGSEFTCPPTGNVFIVSAVDEFQCSATVSPETKEILRKHKCQVLPSRWHFGKEKLQVLVDPRLGSAFSTTLRGYLEDQIASGIEVVQQGVSDNSNDSHCAVLRLEHRGNDGINIFGPASLIGYEGPLRGLDVCGNNIEVANTSAVALAHLARFKQILDLRSKTCRETAPFDFTVVPENAASLPPFSDGQRFKFSLRNTGEAELYFTVVILSPGFHVQQLFP